MFTSSKFAILALLTSQFGSLTYSFPLLEQRIFPPLSLGLASSFGAIAGTTLTSTGATVITGNCGTYPGSAVQGFGTGNQGTCTGAVDAGNTASQTPKPPSSHDLGGLTLTPGIYSFPTINAVLSTTLTLNGTSNPKGQFVFQIKTTFMTAASTSKVLLIGGPQACNVYFLAGSMVKGNVVAYTSVAVGSAADVNGTLGALHGAVTLINNAITAQTSCSS